VAADGALLDTNILLEATDERRRYHADAVALLESVAPLTLSAQIIREYLAVATRQ
jgi:predicted nucleic acid-binding protein